MDKTTIEKCLKVFPEIDKEINRLETEIQKLKIYKEEKLKNKDFYGEAGIKSLFETADAVLGEYRTELNDLCTAQIKINKALPKINDEQRKVIEVRLWNNQELPTKWSEVAEKLNYHRVYAERVYQKTISFILAS